jgi:hypothetical protein
VTDYVLEVLAKCLHCGAAITRKNASGMERVGMMASVTSENNGTVRATHWPSRRIDKEDADDRYSKMDQPEQ